MGAQYELYLTDPLGQTRLAAIDRFTRLEWTRVINDVGKLALVCGAEQLDRRLVAKDRRIEVWRVTEYVPKLVGIYYLVYDKPETTANGKTLTLKGENANGFLNRRVIAYQSGSSPADMTAFADDLCKLYVISNLGGSAAAGRDISAFGFTLQPYLNLGPLLSKAASYQNLLQTLQEICDASYEAGVPLYFDMVHPTPQTIEFRTYIGLRGADRTQTLTPFSLERGTLEPPVSIEHDYTAAANYIYAIGQGVEEDREIAEASDAVAIGESPFGRTEDTATGLSYEGASLLGDYAAQAVIARRATRKFEGNLLDQPNSRYQFDWDFGDLVAAEYDEETFPCLVSAVVGTVTQSEETITAKLTYAD